MKYDIALCQYMNYLILINQIITRLGHIQPIDKHITSSSREHSISVISFTRKRTDRERERKKKQMTQLHIYVYISSCK